MIRPNATDRLIPLSPTVPLHDAAAPRNWTLRPSFDPLDRSQNRILQCLHAEIAIDTEGSLVIILDVKCYEPNPSGSCVRILLANTGVTTKVQPAQCGEGITNIWATVPDAALKEGLAVTLQVISEDIVHDQLVIGSIQVASPLSTVQARAGNKAATGCKPKIVSQTPTMSAPAANDEKIANKTPFSVPEHDDSNPPSDDLPPDYERLCLSVEGDLDLIEQDWKPSEEKAGRRLVRFSRKQLGSLVELSFATQTPCNPHREKSEVVISCISLPDHEDLWVTSFDIVRLAAYVLQIPLNTEMKNRARRNMASVECKTLLRVIPNEDSIKTEAFTVIMEFEDPKPRSIEKSIKIYKWNVLETCLSKILQRFIIYLPDIPTGPVEFEHQLEAVNRWKRSRRGNASTRPLKTRRDVHEPVFVDQDAPKTKRMTRQSQNSDSLTLAKVFPKYEPLDAPNTALKQEIQDPIQAFPEEQDEEEADLSRDQNVTLSSYHTPQPLSAQTTGSPLVVTPLDVDPETVISPLAASSTTTQPGYPRLIRPSLQSRFPSSSSSVPHPDLTIPSHLEGAGDVVLPSPTGTFASSFDSYSPLHSSSSSPRFLFIDPNSIHQQQYSVSSNSSDVYLSHASHPGMASSSSLVTPIHPNFGPYTQLSFGSSEATLVEKVPQLDFHQLPEMPVGPPYSPGLGGISFNPYYPPYTVEGGHMLQLQGLSQEPLAVVKEEEKEINTDEWLNNDYIMSQENDYSG